MGGEVVNSVTVELRLKYDVCSTRLSYWTDNLISETVPKIILRPSKMAFLSVFAGAHPS